LPVTTLALTCQAESQVHVLAPVQNEQERDRDDRGELPDKARGLHRHVLERPNQMPEQLGQAPRVVH